MNTNETEREALEREANLVRARLANTLDALDSRRHQLMDVKLQVRRFARPLMLIGSGLGTLLLGGVAFAIYRSTTSDARRRRQRKEMLPRMWRHPERVGAMQKPSLLAAVGRKLLTSALTMIGMEVLRRGLKHPAVQRWMGPREQRTPLLPAPYVPSPQ